MSAEVLGTIRDRMLPMLRVVAQEYQHRTPDGYPVVVDNVESGVIGLELDPSYGLYVVSEGDAIYADLHQRAPRNDARSSASSAKFSGLPFDDRRPLDPTVSDQRLRNLIAELVSRWNFQPNIIHITDSD